MTLMIQNIQTVCTCTSSANAQWLLMAVAGLSIVLLGIKVFKLLKTK